MKTILFTAILIIGLLGVGDLTITFKPFSISLPGWYKPVGILLFFLSMAVYTIGEYTKGYKQTIFGESFLIGWFPFSSHWYNKLKIIK